MKCRVCVSLSSVQASRKVTTRIVNSHPCTQNPTHTGVINREDVASLVVQALGSDKCTRKELTAIDPSIPSAYNYEKNMVAHKF